MYSRAHETQIISASEGPEKKETNMDRGGHKNNKSKTFRVRESRGVSIGMMVKLRKMLIEFHFPPTGKKCALLVTDT